MTVSLHATDEWPYQVGAGGLVYREIEGSREYAILIRKNYAFDKDKQTYNLTKGRVDNAENLEQTAVREVLEESGITAQPVAYLGSLHRKFTIHIEIDRSVHYFLMKFKSRDERKMDDEHDELVWMDAEEAINALGKNVKSENVIVERAEEWFRKFSDNA